MARIRTVKPEFFLDEDIADDLTHTERLAFIGLWCQCDKAGRTKDRPRRLKVQIFPHEDVDFEAVLSRLEATRYIQRYEVCGRRYIQVRTFDEHQRPRTDEPETQIPPPPPLTNTVTGQSLNSDSSDSRKGMGKGTGKEIRKGEVTAGAVVKLWNEIVTRPIPQVRRLTADRTRKVNARLREYPDLSSWRTVISWLNAQDWCRANGRGEHPNWTATLDWLVKSDGVFQRWLEQAETGSPTTSASSDDLRAELFDVAKQAGQRAWFRDMRVEDNGQVRLVVSSPDHAEAIRPQLEEALAELRPGKRLEIARA